MKEYKVLMHGEMYLYITAENENEAAEKAEFEIWEDMKEAIRAYDIEEITENDEV